MNDAFYRAVRPDLEHPTWGDNGGQPAISLPLGKDSTGLPLGVQLIRATAAKTR